MVRNKYYLHIFHDIFDCICHKLNIKNIEIAFSVKKAIYY
jgi:hypothetical protein